VPERSYGPVIQNKDKSMQRGYEFIATIERFLNCTRQRVKR